MSLVFATHLTAVTTAALACGRSSTMHSSITSPSSWTPLPRWGDLVGPGTYSGSIRGPGSTSVGPSTGTPDTGLSAGLTRAGGSAGIPGSFTPGGGVPVQRNRGGT